MSLISLNIGTRPRAVRGEFPPLGRNAFRVLGLAAPASQREVFEAASGLRLALKLGVEKSFEEDAAWLGPVSRAEPEVRDALGRLTDPARRAEERLLWFHAPPPAGAESVEALVTEADALLLRGDAAARHDAALLLLAGLSVLDPSLRAPEAWARCFGLWRGLTEGEEFWSLLVALDLKGEYEQLVTYGEARELRRRVPRLVSEPLAGRAKSDAVRGRAGFCGRALVVLRAGGLPPPLLDEYENDILGPLEDRLQGECEAVFERAETGSRGSALTGHDRGSIYNFAWRTFEYEFKPKLAAFAAAGGAENPSVRRALEHAALKLSWLAARYRANDQPDTALKALGQARLLAPPGSSAALQLEEELSGLGHPTASAARAADDTAEAAEYAASLAKELDARREPPAPPPFEGPPSPAPRNWVSEAAGGVSHLAVWLLMLAGCYLLGTCGVIKPGRSGRYKPPGYNFNYNFNYNYRPNLNLKDLNLDAIPYPPPTTTTRAPERRRPPRRRGGGNATRNANAGARR